MQPVLPELAHDFGVAPADSSLALSLTTGGLAVALLSAEAAARVIGRKTLMFAGLCGSALLNIAGALVPGWSALLIGRTLEGIALGGVPSVAMAYIGEEVEPGRLGLMMGLYIGGTAFGGMIGRIGMGALSDWLSWRGGMAIIGAFDLLAALGFMALLPPPRERHVTGRNSVEPWRAWFRQMLRPGLLPLFAIGFLVMGAFVTVYNYSSFRLLAPPYALTVTGFSLIYSVFLFGMLASPLAGTAADRIGRAPVMITGVCIAMTGVALTLLSGLVWIIIGIAVVTVGFFVSHSTASGWLSQLSWEAPGHASAQYLLAYYVGGSVMGWLGGYFWLAHGWGAVAGFTAVLLMLALGLSLRLRRISSPVPSGR